MNIKPLFIGPKAENIDIYESLILEIVRDAGYYRKNIFTQDKPLISENDKSDEGFLSVKSELIEQFNAVLSKLKESLPTFHPRHIGHMFGDLLIPAVAGYIGGILYNPNNVVGEVSPVTTRMELDFIQNLSKMAGYGEIATNEATSGSWGHITGGGTTANIEALWLARNLKYFPLSLKLLSEDEQTYEFLKNCTVELPSGKTQPLLQCSYSELFRLTPQESYSLWDKSVALFKSIGEKNPEHTFVKAIEKFSIQKTGLYELHNIIEKKSSIKLPVPCIFVSKTAHYSWKKTAGILGIGENQVVTVDVDKNFRLDIEDLKRKINIHDSVLAVISIFGTTEEGAIDPLSDILSLRTEQEAKNDSFYVHVDAAYGGYFLSMLKDEEYRNIPFNDFKKFFSAKKEEPTYGFRYTEEDTAYLFEKSHLIDEKWTEHIVRSNEADSLTIDPHKLGYVPYPAGAVLYKNALTKRFLSQVAPYLDSAEENHMFLGKWSVEGSRPGASAVACYLASEVVPLNQRGYGTILANTLVTTSRFIKKIDRFNQVGDFKIITLYKPDTNIFCYLVTAPDIIKNPKWLNVFSNNIYNAFSAKKGRKISDSEFIVSKSSWKYKDYETNINDILNKAGISNTENHTDFEELIYLRSTFMNPLSAGLEEAYYDTFWKKTSKIAEESISEIMLKIINEKYKGKRLKILWLENDQSIIKLKQELEKDPLIGKYLEITFIHQVTALKFDTIKTEYDTAIVDLNLNSDDHRAFEEIQSGIEVIRNLQENGIEKLIVYSQYLNPDNENYYQAKSFLTYQTPAIKKIIEEKFLIGKTEKQSDLKNIIKAVFLLSH